MRGVLSFPAITFLASAGLLASCAVGATSLSPADYEADELNIVKSLAVHLRGLNQGRPLCVDLRLLALQPGAAAEAPQWARRAREAGGEPGFEVVERALRRDAGHAATVDRRLDGDALAGAPGLAGARLVERCPAPQWVTLYRVVRSRHAAMAAGAIAGPCSSGSLTAALRRRGRGWRIEGVHFRWIGVPPGCGDAVPGDEPPEGQFLLIGETR